MTTSMSAAADVRILRVLESLEGRMARIEERLAASGSRDSEGSRVLKVEDMRRVNPHQSLSPAAFQWRGLIKAFSQVRELDYSGLGWTDVDALIDALSTTSDGKDHRPQAGEKACRKLQYLWLFDNPICDPEKALVRLKGALGEECEICGLSAA